MVFTRTTNGITEKIEIEFGLEELPEDEPMGSDYWCWCGNPVEICDAHGGCGQIDEMEQ